MTQDLQNAIVPRTEQLHLIRVQEAAVHSFLSQKGHCPTGKSTLEAWQKLTFFKQLLNFCLFSLPVRSCPAMKYIAAGTMRSLGAVTPLGCLWPENKKIPVFKALSGTFSATQISRHVRVSWHATSCKGSHIHSFNCQPQRAAGLSAPGWKQRAAVDACILCNHLLSKQANYFCQLWDWVTFWDISEETKHSTQDSKLLQTVFLLPGTNF